METPTVSRSPCGTITRRVRKGINPTLLIPVLLVGILAMTPGGGSAQASPPIPVDQCGQVVSSPGRYIVTTDLICFSSDFGIAIRADDVHVDFAGHSIAVQGGWGIDAIGSKITIEGGSVGGPNASGIHAVGNRIRIKSMNVNGSHHIGIQLVGGDDRVVDSAVNGGEAIIAGSNNLIKGNQITAISDGIEANSSNTISDNAVGGFVGIVVSGTDNNVRGNAVVGAEGIAALTGAINNVIQSNTATSSETNFIDDNPGAPPNCPNTWKNNTFTTASGAGAACIQ